VLFRSRPPFGGTVGRAAVTAFALVSVLIASNVLANMVSGEGSEGVVTSIMDPTGRVVTQISHQVFRGDQYLLNDNTLYEVYSAKGPNAWARNKGKLDVSNDISRLQRAQIFPGGGPNQPVVNQAPGPIGVYFSHNDEGYVTNQGVPNLHSGAGGIHNVGSAFAQALAAKGLTVIKSDALHYPHDPSAYIRSRRTALELLINRPAALFDIHRDAAPQATYAAYVNGQWVTKLVIVVGRQNANIALNRAFAVALRDIAEQEHPGLVRGIFMAHGNYNQDLLPRALLLEVGSQENAEQSAQRGIALFASSVATYFGVK